MAEGLISSPSYRRRVLLLSSYFMASLHTMYLIAGYLLINGQIESLAWLLYFVCLSCLAINQIAFSFINYSKTYEKVVSVSEFKTRDIEPHHMHAAVFKEIKMHKQSSAQNVDSGKLIMQADVGECLVNHSSGLDPEAATALHHREESEGKFRRCY